MKKTLLVIVYVFIFSNVAVAKTVEREVTPKNVTNHNWNVTTIKTDHTTTFSFFIPFKDGKLPKGTSVNLKVFNGKQLVCSVTPQVQTKDGKACVRFTVVNGFLADSKFSITKIDISHPSGDIYWANLEKFAEAEKKENP